MQKKELKYLVILRSSKSKKNKFKIKKVLKKNLSETKIRIVEAKANAIPVYSLTNMNYFLFPKFRFLSLN